MLIVDDKVQENALHHAVDSGDTTRHPLWPRPRKQRRPISVRTLSQVKYSTAQALVDKNDVIPRRQGLNGTQVVTWRGNSHGCSNLTGDSVNRPG